MLFEIGTNALYDGYYREAIGSFTASYERFLEFFIRIVYDATGDNEETFDKTWKNVSQQSERQLGAYVFAFYSLYNVPPDLLPRKMVEFRNAVIHKGKIPTRGEAIQFGESVINIVLPVLRNLFDTHQYAVVAAATANVDAKDPPSLTYYPYMTLPTNRKPDEKTPSMEQLLEGIAAGRKSTRRGSE
ncbi:hypothetical protein RBSH_02059 [Rhodopirellula baltica SH28]|uniref:Uncharacterized protein n=1 Tax=Rhodopirellula baltica SH28 TaxID=993517 RepID=K5D792_RHOBT|nr:hypothetical protein [Rhodopirellula baltica]EKK02627.1 hypothetical protein RBSH_02059 [Rhodopirellula baltica SH28]